MKIINANFLWGVLFATVLLMPFSFASSPQTGLTSSPWLHSSGINVYDEGGQQISLNGINFHLSQGENLTLADLQTAKALGFNSFRVNNVYWGLSQPYNESTNGIDSQYFATGISAAGAHTHMVPLDTVVNLAVQTNMYVIICMWAWSGYYVPPQWAFPSIPHTGNNQVWGDDNFERSVSEQAYSGLINGAAAKERTGLINTWRSIANRYKGIPNVMFELLNEPYMSDVSLAGTSYRIFNEAMISAIESVETLPHLKLVELLRDHYDQEITQGSMDVNKPNVIWATHHYSPMTSYNPLGTYWHDSFTWHGRYLPAGWGNGTTYVAWRLIRVASQIHGWNRPWMVTEFSKQVTQSYWQDWFKIVMNTMIEQHVSGWQYFCYSSDPTHDAGWNIGQLTTRQAIMPVLKPYLSTQVSTTSIASTTSLKSTSTTSSTTTQGPLAPSTVGTSTDSRAAGSPYQAKSCFQSSLFWVWYSDGGSMVFKTSIDGVKWSGPTIVRAASSGLYFGIYCDGTYVHYAFGNNAANGPLFYRRGLTKSDGTITWSTAEQTVVAAQPCCANTKPSVTVDSNGNPWIAYQWVNFTTMVVYVPKIIKSITSGGTWTTANGFPYSLASSSASVQVAGVVPLTGGKVVALYAKSDGAKVNLRTWNGTGWNPSVSTAKNVADSKYWSAVSQGNYVHLVYLGAGATGSVTYVKYSYSSNSFGSETVLQGNTTNDAAPAISIDGSINNLYCFWSGTPQTKHIYYREYQASNATWLTRVDWLTEVGLTGNDRLSSFNQAPSNYLGLVYMNNPGNPYQVRFDSLTMPSSTSSLPQTTPPCEDQTRLYSVPD